MRQYEDTLTSTRLIASTLYIIENEDNCDSTGSSIAQRTWEMVINLCPFRNIEFHRECIIDGLINNFVLAIGLE